MGDDDVSMDQILLLVSRKGDSNLLVCAYERLDVQDCMLVVAKKLSGLLKDRDYTEEQALHTMEECMKAGLWSTYHQ